MAADAPSIFVTPEDHVSWDRYAQQIDLIELTNDEKQRATTGIQYLRQLLGEDFLQRAVEKGNPIFGWFFANAAPHARRSLIRLAEELKSFENADGFKGLVRRFKLADKAAEALTVLGAASNFARVGFQVSFDPQVPNIRTVPDLLLSETGEEIYVEVSRLRKSNQHEKDSHAYNTIHGNVQAAIFFATPDNFIGPHVRPYVRIRKSIPKENLQSTAEQVVREIFEAARKNEYREFKNDLVEMAVSPSHDYSQAEAWAKERHQTELVEAPPIDFSRELRRARDKIGKEMRQLPRDKPGILVVPTENLLFFIHHGEDIVAVLAERLRRHPHLLCAGYSDSFVDVGQNTGMKTLGEHALVTTTTDIATNRTAFMMNGAFGLSISTSTLEKVRSAFVPPDSSAR